MFEQGNVPEKYWSADRKRAYTIHVVSLIAAMIITSALTYFVG